MKTVSLNLYKYDELTPEAQEKALNWYRELNSQLDYDWYNATYEVHKEKASSKGFDIDQIYFSGFSSQGDGACFEYSGDSDKLFKDFVTSLNLSPLRKRWLLSQGAPYASGKHSGRYYHENSCSHTISIETEFSYRVYPLLGHWIESFTTDFEAFVVDAYKDICRELYKALEAEYEYLQSDSVLIDNIISNEYDFTESGIKFSHNNVNEA